MLHCFYPGMGIQILLGSEILYSSICITMSVYLYVPPEPMEADFWNVVKTKVLALVTVYMAVFVKIKKSLSLSFLRWFSRCAVGLKQGKIFKVVLLKVYFSN